MKTYPILFCLLLSLSFSAFSQEKNWLRTKMKNADTVLLVSHEATAGVTIMDSAGNSTPPPTLLAAGQPNYKIIKEQQIITGAQIDSLVKILDRPFQDQIVETGKCFIPHHALFILKKGKVSYIEICFACKWYETSRDMNMIYAFDRRKWMELENYLRQLGLTYEL